MPLPKIVLVGRCFIMRADHKTLIVKRSATDRHNPAQWEVAGGKADRGQDLETSRNREVLEETGLIVRSTKALNYTDTHMVKDGPYTGFLYLAIFSVAELAGGNLVLSSEHDDALWVTYDEMLTYDLTNECRRAAIALEQYLK